MVERQEVVQQHVTFPGAGIQLEGILHLPQNDGAVPAVAVCHPHPLFGGDMYNNVVLAVCNGLARASIASFRFNFRGVGGSEGEHDEGIGEQRDVIAALAFLESVAGIDSTRIGLAGYSFGTKVAVPVALAHDKVKALALVSPFLGASEWDRLGSYAVPKLLLCGSADDFVSSEEVQRWAKELDEPEQCQVISGADHFWWGNEGDIAERLAVFFTTALSAT
jgi:alpha/beta superfamily hydrolase